ncbi:hypothetical protein B0H12DRAFT_1159982 [Mycena haematopus]|nr:hypothetical protein B0H12DRAFT_1159982 [Mycena haematopus]
MLKILLLLLLWALILSTSSPSSSSLAHRHERSVRGVRNAAMESPYAGCASPRRRCSAANPLRDVGNLLRVQGQAAGIPSLDQERDALCDADRARQQALQEMPSQRHRRVPRREDEENRAVSPTLGARRAVPPLGLVTPADSQVPSAAANKRASVKRARHDRENAAKAAAASAGPSTSRATTAPVPASARSLGQLARSQREREQAADAGMQRRLQLLRHQHRRQYLLLRLPVRPARALRWLTTATTKSSRAIYIYQRHVVHVHLHQTQYLLHGRGCGWWSLNRRRHVVL